MPFGAVTFALRPLQARDSPARAASTPPGTENRIGCQPRAPNRPGRSILSGNVAHITATSAQSVLSYTPPRAGALVAAAISAGVVLGTSLRVSQPGGNQDVLVPET